MMITASRASLKLLSISIGLLFTGAVYYTMHYNPRWDWTAPGVGQLPQDIVRGYLSQAYGKGQGASARRAYFAPDAVDNVASDQDDTNGAPIPHEVRSVIVDGLTVVVLHRVGPARGQPAMDLIEIFQMKDGRIVRRDRYPTQFAPQARVSDDD